MERQLVRSYAQQIGEAALSEENRGGMSKDRHSNGIQRLLGNKLGTPDGTSDPDRMPSMGSSTGGCAGWWLWPLFELLLQLIWTVERCVFGYFVAFVSCWNVILVAFVALIFGYYKLLGFLIERLTAWPMNLIAIIGMGIALGMVALLFHVILPYK